MASLIKELLRDHGGIAGAPLDSHDQRLPRYFCPRPLSLQLHLCHFPGCRCARNVPRHLLELGAEGANDALKPGETREIFTVDRSP